MSSSINISSSTVLPSPPSQCTRSPEFSDTINNHLFMQHVVKQVIDTTRQQTTDNVNDTTIRQSLEEISKDIKEIEDFLTVTEDILKREKERDKEFYARERQRKLDLMTKNPPDVIKTRRYNKENKSPLHFNRRFSLKPATYKINNSAAKTRRIKSGSPRAYRSRLYFRNGRIGCVDADENASNIQSTHELVKNIIQLENDCPLVSPENVEKILRRSFMNKTDHHLYDSDQSLDFSSNEDFLTTPTADNSSDNIEMNETSYRSSDKSESEPVVVDTPIEDVPLNIVESRSASNCDTDFRSISAMDMEPKTPMPGSASSIQSNATLNSEVKTQVRHLVRRFTTRANNMRTRMDLPTTPSSSVTSSPSPPPQSNSELTPKGKNENITETEFATTNRGAVVTTMFEADQQSNRCNYLLCSPFCNKTNNGVLDSQGWFYIAWLSVVSMSFLYNAWVIPLRSSFPFQTVENTNIWLAIDFCVDVIYLIDVVFIKHRLMYLYEGFWVRDKNSTRKNYMRKLQFKMDILSLTPLDLLYLKFGTRAVFLRTPRLLKIQSFWEFFKLLDRVISSPHMLRVAKTLTYMLYMIHLTACTYYAYSSYQGLGTDRWVFSGKGHPYVRCFVFATKTATSIGKNPKPESEGELLFMTAAWLMGVFVFALLIGQIRDIIATATRTQSEYRQLVDETLEYMRRLNLPTDMQRRVKMWFQFTWEQQRTLDEGLILDYLPANLKTDIAISVHIQTLSKVQLFSDCEEALLRDLVLKLRSVTFLPGDYVCRKGEVGKEMYIVKLGQVQVMGGIKNDEVLATLSESSVFGEISLLAITGPGGNRRTADVRSKGFSNLFVLSKSDLNEAIVYYPNAQAVLKRRAKTLVRKNEEREREEAKAIMKNAEADVVIGNPTRPQTPPKFLRTVMQALPEESEAAKLLTQGSKRIKRKKKIENVIDDDPNCEIVTIENEKRKLSLDLLISIQQELEKGNMSSASNNLTDAEKAMMRPNNIFVPYAERISDIKYEEV